MIATCSNMEVIQNMFNLIMSETMMEYQIIYIVIMNMSDNNIIFILMAYRPMFIMGQLKLKSLSLRIYQDIFVPWIK